MRGKLIVVALLFSLTGHGFITAQESIDKYEVPPARQPAPTVPDLSPQMLKAMPKTFSVFDPQSSIPNELRKTSPSSTSRGNGTDTSGTQALQQSHSFGTPGVSSGRRGFSEAGQANAGTADQSPALNSIRPQFGNELRPQPDADDELPVIRPIGDSRLGFDTPPTAPQQNERSDPRLPNEYDPNSGTSFPPVNNSPLVPQQQIRQPNWNAQTNPRIDDSVRPVTYQAPLQPAANNQSNNQPLVKQLLSRYDIDNAPDPLPGKPMKLVDLLKTTSFNKRFQLVNQYWETYEEWALLINAAERLRWLNNNMQVSAQNDQALLEAAKSAAANMVMESEIRLKEAQATLQRIANLPASDLLPLPSDHPLVTPFATHFEYFAKRRQMPAILKSLDDMMPKTLQLVQTRARTVDMTRRVLDQNRNGAMSGQTTLSSVLTAVDLWNRSEIDLIRSVGKYNRSTAQYAFNFRPNQQNNALVKMLIGKKKKLDANSLPVSRTAQLPINNRNLQRQRDNFSNRRTVTPPNQTLPGNEFSLQGPASESSNDMTNINDQKFSQQRNASEDRFQGGNTQGIPQPKTFAPPSSSGFQPRSNNTPPAQNPAFDASRTTPPPSQPGFGR